MTEQPTTGHPSARTGARSWEYPLAAVLGALLIVVPALTRLGYPGMVPLTWPDVTLTLVSAAALTQMRRHPLLTLTVTGLATLVGVLGDWTVNLAQIALSIAVFAYALARPVRRSVVAAVVATLVFEVATLLAPTHGNGPWRREDVVLWLWLMTAIAVAVQSRRTTIAALTDRAVRAEQTREETARRRVAEERLRIAGELHDVIAHHVAVIGVQAGAAERMIGRNEQAVAEAVGTIRRSAKEVLAELQDVLQVLRDVDGDPGADPHTPVKRLDDVAELIGTFRKTGMAVALSVSGPVPAVPAQIDLAAFRVVQEGLTNAHKHAPGSRVSVTVTTADDAGRPLLEVAVHNTRPARPQARPDAEKAGSGLGLVGMRERVTGAGGSLHTGPAPGGGYQVTAVFPVPAPETPTPTEVPT